MMVKNTAGLTSSLVVDSNNNVTTAPGQLSTLLCEALPTVTTSTQIFANAPVNTKEIWLTIRTAGITLRGDGQDATAGANGNDFAKDSPAPLVLIMNQTEALRVRAIANGGASTGFITYRG
jgi:hypothetical protein